MSNVIFIGAVECFGLRDILFSAWYEGFASPEGSSSGECSGSILASQYVDSPTPQAWTSYIAHRPTKRTEFLLRPLSCAYDRWVGLS